MALILSHYCYPNQLFYYQPFSYEFKSISWRHLSISTLRLFNSWLVILYQIILIFSFQEKFTFTVEAYYGRRLLNKSPLNLYKLAPISQTPKPPGF